MARAGRRRRKADGNGQGNGSGLGNVFQLGAIPGLRLLELYFPPPTIMRYTMQSIPFNLPDPRALEVSLLNTHLALRQQSGI